MNFLSVVDKSSQSAGFRFALGRCARLVLVAAFVWCCAAFPAWWLARSEGLQGLTIAAVLCTTPGCLVFLAAAFVAEGSSQAAMVALGGTALRLVFVLVGAIAVRAIRPELQMREFLIWLVVYYLVMLAAETVLVVRKTPAT